MNTVQFLSQSDEFRRRYYSAAEEKCGLPGIGIEKDLWVCETLKILTEIPSCKDVLTFKGGTSLSKGWKLIERFSEDIDVVIDRERLGIRTGPLEEWETLGSNARKRELEKLGTTCRDFVQNHVKGELGAAVKQRFPSLSNSVNLFMDKMDESGQTLLFSYHSAYDHSPYLQPRVKIELGARSDIEPNAHPEIGPYLKEALPNRIEGNSFPIRTVTPERTFWEKAMLLHEETYRPPGSPKKRMSRHYYDLYKLLEANIGEKASSNPHLFENVARHRRIFFRRSRKAQDTLVRGTLRLLPGESDKKAWEQDYLAMLESMFFGEPPDFKQILLAVERFESSFNS